MTSASVTSGLQLSAEARIQTGFVTLAEDCPSRLHVDCDIHPRLTLEPHKAKQVPRLRTPGADLTLDQLSPEPLLEPAEASGMSQSRGRYHNKKAGIRAAVILIGLLHKSRKAKEREKEREREEGEGWVKFVMFC